MSYTTEELKRVSKIWKERRLGFDIEAEVIEHEEPIPVEEVV